MTALDRLADISDPRFTDDQRATLARFEAAPTPPEVVDAVVAEIASRYRDPDGARFAINDFRDWLDDHPAAVAAYRAAQDGGAEEAVRRDDWLYNEASGALYGPTDSPHLRRIVATEVEPAFGHLIANTMNRAALAPQAGDGAR